jgi:hypothetical protein
MRTPVLLLGFLTLSYALPTANVTCPKTPTPWPAASTYPSMSTLPDPFTYLDEKTRVASRDEWYQCRQPEILSFLQEYQYGFYPGVKLCPFFHKSLGAERFGGLLREFGSSMF